LHFYNIYVMIQIMHFERRYDSATGQWVGPSPEMAALLRGMQLKAAEQQQARTPSPQPKSTPAYAGTVYGRGSRPRVVSPPAARHTPNRVQPQPAYISYIPATPAPVRPFPPNHTPRESDSSGNPLWESAKFVGRHADKICLGASALLLTGAIYNIHQAFSENVNATMSNPDLTFGTELGTNSVILAGAALVLSGVNAVVGRMRSN
jgi:hypothetical protein